MVIEGAVLLIVRLIPAVLSSDVVCGGIAEGDIANGYQLSQYEQVKSNWPTAVIVVLIIDKER